MVTIAHLVKKKLLQKPFLVDALGRGLINNAALAEEMLPAIQKELGKKIKFSAVNMAIRRLAETLPAKGAKEVRFDKTTDIIIRSDLLEIILYKTELANLQKYVQETYSLVNLKEGDFLTITQGLYEVMLITNRKYEEQILKKIPKRAIKKRIKRLSSLTINIPDHMVETVGFFYVLCRALNWENINIVDIVSTFTELTFILNENDTGRAFSIMKEVIQAYS